MFFKTYKSLFLILLCGIAAIQLASAQNTQKSGGAFANLPTETSVDKLVKIQRFLNIYSSIGRFSGVAMLAKDGQPIHKFTTKYSTLDFKIRCALSTQFNTCEISQAFTATAIMQLIDQGKLDLNDKIGQYLFQLPTEIGENITIHQLLSHSSGLKNYYKLEEYRERFYDIQDKETLIQLATKYGLEFSPGNEVKNSNTGYVLLGSLIEKISGISYRDFIQKNIFQPNDMKQSGVYSWFDPAEQQAVGYLPNRAGKPKEAPEYWGAHAFGSDGLHCSVEDLLKFSNAFHSGKMLSPKAKKMMLSPYFTNSRNSNDHLGYGWRMKDIESEKVIYQEGALGGHSAVLRHYLQDGYTVLIFSNFGEKTANKVADKIEKILTVDHTTVPNYASGFILYEMIGEKGIDYVSQNFDAIAQQNNLEFKDMWPYYSLGQDFMKENQPHVAQAIFQLGVAKYPNAPMLYDALGDYYHTAGNKAMAKQSFERKLQLSPSDARAKRMLEVIEKTTYANAPKEFQDTKKLVNNPSQKEQKEAFIKTSYKPETETTNTQSKVVATSNTTFADKKIYTTVDVMPEFPGGQTALHQYIYQNLRYPTLAYINAIEGTVYVDFIVDSYGNIVNAQANSNIKGDNGGLEMEALRLINGMPRWTPGKHQGASAVVKLTIPIQFNKGQFMSGTTEGR